jgi:hypothetical protein
MATQSGQVTYPNP